MYTPSETCLHRCSGRVDAHFFQTHVKSLARKTKLALFWLCLPLKQTKLNIFEQNGSKQKGQANQTNHGFLSTSKEYSRVFRKIVTLTHYKWIAMFLKIPTKEWTRPKGVVPYKEHHDFHNHGIMDLIAEFEFVVKREYHETDYLTEILFWGKLECLLLVGSWWCVGPPISYFTKAQTIKAWQSGHPRHWKSQPKMTRLV